MQEQSPIHWAQYLEPVARRLLGEPNKRLTTRAELRYGTNGSLSIRIAGENKGTWFDHENKTGGGVLDLISRELQLANGEAVEWMKSELRIETGNVVPMIAPARPKQMKIVETYNYRDENHELLSQVCRLDPKDFRQRRINPETGKWEWKVKGTRQVPYRLPEWIGQKDRTILIVEGEKDVDRLYSLGLLATTNAGGAGKWPGEFRDFFVGREVVIIPDNDTPGREHADLIVDNLLPVTASVRVVHLPGLPEKGDVSDWLDAGHGRSDLIEIIARNAVLARSDGETSPGQEQGAIDDDDAPVLLNHPLHDIGNAKRLIDHHQDAVLYVEGMGWLVWDGARYALDAEACAVRGLAHRTIERMVLAAMAEPARGKEQQARHKALVKFCIGSGNSQRIAGMIKQAEPMALKAGADLDRNPWLLNCRNGTVDLRTGDLRPHERGDLITKMCEIDYDPRATCSRWERFMLEIFDGDAEVVAFVRRALGYSLTGLTTEQVIFILHGAGSNGKSVLLETVAAIMGDYLKRSPSDTWVSKQNSGPSNDIAALVSARFVAVVETEHQKQLAEALVKQATGGEGITARFLHKEFFTFLPKFKLWLATNHLPKIKGTEFAIWRRIILLAFKVTFNERDQLLPGQKERDPELKNELVREHSGILTWMVGGCVEWSEVGLKPPASVIHATEGYQDSQDSVSGFIRECCRIDRAIECEAGILYAGYELWCEENDQHAVSNTAFGTGLADRGHPLHRTMSVRLRKGIDLTTEMRLAATHRIAVKKAGARPD